MYFCEFSDFLRINGSHNTIDWHKKISRRIKSINSQTKILFDLPGIKPRVKNITNIQIKKNQRVLFFYGAMSKEFVGLKINTTKPIPKIKKKLKTFSLSDGKFLFNIIRSGKNFIIGKSLENFNLSTRQGINIPFSKYDEKKQLKVYLDFLKKVNNKVKFDAIGLSFVQTEQVVKKIKSMFKKKAIISKIENMEGLRNIVQISKYSDAIMIDRGDLAAEIGDGELFDSIIHISNECKKNGTPLILATENLGSMLDRSSPTKSEVISLGFSKQLNVDRVMLSEETAIYKNCFKILDWLKKFLSNQDNKIIKIKQKKDFSFWDLFKLITDIPIILFTKKGYAINNILNLNLKSDFFIFTDNEKIKTTNSLRSNTETILTKKFDKKNLNRFISSYIKSNLNRIFKNSTKAVLVFVANPRKSSRANTIQFVSKKDF